MSYMASWVIKPMPKCAWSYAGKSKELRNYVHLGTGNYHPKTAQIYTDYGLFSCDKELGEDVRRVFAQLTSLGKVTQIE